MACQGPTRRKTEGAIRRAATYTVRLHALRRFSGNADDGGVGSTCAAWHERAACHPRTPAPTDSSRRRRWVLVDNPKVCGISLCCTRTHLARPPPSAVLHPRFRSPTAARNTDRMTATTEPLLPARDNDNARQRRPPRRRTSATSPAPPPTTQWTTPAMSPACAPCRPHHPPRRATTTPATSPQPSPTDFAINGNASGDPTAHLARGSPFDHDSPSSNGDEPHAHAFDPSHPGAFGHPRPSHSPSTRTISAAYAALCGVETRRARCCHTRKTRQAGTGLARVRHLGPVPLPDVPSGETRRGSANPCGSVTRASSRLPSTRPFTRGLEG
jgi:hypothetical protein